MASGYTIKSYTGSAVDLELPTTVGSLRVDNIYSSAFALNSTLKKITGNSILSIGSSAFSSTNIQAASFPNCEYVGSYAFEFARSLSNIEISKCSYIGNGAFQHTSVKYISLPECLSTGWGAFNYCALTSVSFPKLTWLGSGTFSGCQSLTTVNLPSCSYICSSAFFRCSNLTSISIPQCSYIGQSALSYCSSLMYSLPTVSVFKYLPCYSGIALISNWLGSAVTSLPESTAMIYGSLGYNNYRSSTLSLSNCYAIGCSAFSYALSITSVNLDKCKYIDTNAFEYCSALEYVNIPECISIASYAFENCSNLSYITLSKCKYLGYYAFSSCSKLTTIDLPVCSNLAGNVFWNCTSLSEIYLRSTSRVSLYNSNTFYSTGITSSTGSIYVPASLISSYKENYQWSYFASRFFSIPEV